MSLDAVVVPLRFIVTDIGGCDDVAGGGGAGKLEKTKPYSRLGM